MCGQSGAIQDIPKMNIYGACDTCLKAYAQIIEVIIDGGMTRDETEHQVLLRLLHWKRGLTEPTIVLVLEDNEIVDLMPQVKKLCDQYWHMRKQTP